MAGSPFDSAMLRDLFPAGEAARLFSDSAELRAMLIVEGALAKVQGAAGIIPELSATFLHRALMEIQIDPAGLAAETGRNGVPVPALVAAARKALEAPEHAQYLHWGATSQDILDSALMLRLKRLLEAMEADLDALLAGLARLASEHVELPCLARTYGQAATLTSFGAVAAGWGWPLHDLRRELEGLRAGSLWVSLSGAAGTASVLGPDPAALRAALAEALGLGDPGRSWHSDRGPILRIVAWLARVAAACGKIAGDLMLLTRTGVGEVRLSGGGASSTMPQKQNPVGPAAVAALAAHVRGLAGTMQGAGSWLDQRDGAAWFTEWLALPQLCLSAAAALGRCGEDVAGLEPDAAAMAAALEATQGTHLAEALSFALARRMPRPEAQAAVKALCRELGDRGLVEAARERWPDLGWPDLDWPDHDGSRDDPLAGSGTAVADARRFAEAVGR